VRDGTIVSLTSPDAEPVDPREVIDASGLLVIPGGIEPHAHLAHFISMRTESEMYTVGPEADTVGMAFGGVTTHIDFAQIYPGTTAEQGIKLGMDGWQGKSLIDYAFHVNSWALSRLARSTRSRSSSRRGFRASRSLPAMCCRRDRRADPTNWILVGSVG